jgi:predicted nucleotidyltransferase
LALAILDNFVKKLKTWSKRHKEVKGAAIVGSWARGTARPDSDIDVILITPRPDDLLNNQEWLSEFGAAEKIEREDWGLVQSLRVFYMDKQEIEFGITTEQWTSPEEINLGTGEIILDGIVVVYDPHKLLEKAIDLTKGSQAESGKRRPR